MLFRAFLFRAQPPKLDTDCRLPQQLYRYGTGNNRLLHSTTSNGHHLHLKMSAEPSDEIVKNEILSTVTASMQAHMRPNKLRKLICKQVNGTNWTQYQRVLDKLIKKGSLSTQAVGGEEVILSLNANAAPAPEKQDAPNVITADVEVPFEIILHLTKKGHQKQKNVELNTKTKITFDAETKKALRTHLSDVKTGSLTISRSWSWIPDDELNEKEAKEAAEKQLNAAKIMISQMVKAFEKNPDRFVIAKAGGTFAEQDEAKKRKLEATRRGPQHKKNSQNEDAVDEAAEKKHRRFY